MCANAVTKREFDDTDCIRCAVKIVLVPKKEKQLTVGCFEKCGLFSGYNDLYRHIRIALFNTGIPLRNLNLPKVTDSYIHVVLSLGNVSITPGNRVHRAEHSMTNKTRMLQQYAEARGGFRKNFTPLGLLLRYSTKKMILGP